LQIITVTTFEIANPTTAPTRRMERHPTLLGMVPTTCMEARDITAAGFCKQAGKEGIKELGGNGEG